MQNIWLY